MGLFELISGPQGGEMLVRVSTICKSGGDFRLFLAYFGLFELISGLLEPI